MMMCHPRLVKKWASFLKPLPTEREIQQARLMREAKQRKRDFIECQGKLFDQAQKETA